MSSPFLRFARKSLPPAAATTITAAACLVTANVYGGDDDNNGNNNNNDASKLPIYPFPQTISRSFSLLKCYNTNSPFLSNVAFCEAPRAPSNPTPTAEVKNTPYKPVDPTEPNTASDDPTLVVNSSDGKEIKMGGSMWGGGADNDGLYHGLFPRRQLWRPNLEYPLWDYNWDGRQPPPIVISNTSSSQEEESSEKSAQDAIKIAEAKRERYIRKNGVTRHVILIRHGQYDETHKEDEKRLLTPLGRKQAELTGKRLGELIRGVNEEFGPCRVKVVRVSDLARAKETADIIYDNMDLQNNFDGEDVERSEPDPLLNEGRPCHHIPGGKARASVIERTDEHHPRIEQAFRKYFFRAEPPALPPPDVTKDDEKTAVATSPTSIETKDSPEQTNEPNDENQPLQLKPDPQHEFEIIVCHANVIRYFFCRALQLPPEAWLRLCVFNCSLTYFTIRPTGTVSCRMLGDIGHLPYDMNTFSMHTGFNW